MDATVLAVLFGIIVATCGRSIAVRLDPQAPPFALGACIALAAAVVFTVNVASHWRFTPWLLAGSWLVLAAIGVITRRPARTRRIDPARLTIIGFAVLFAAVPMLIFPVPLDTDEQGFGHLALAIRDSGTLNTMAPWRSGIAYLYSPGALIVFAAFSALTSASMAAVMMGISHATAVLVVWLAWELGEEVDRADGSSRVREESLWARATAASACLSVGLWTALLDSHVTAVLALFFILGFVVAVMRYCRTGALGDLASAAVLLAAVPITHSDSASIAGFAVVALALLSRAGRDAPPTTRWIAGTLVPPLAALTIAAPWLISLTPLIETGIRSPYEVNLAYVRGLLLFHGLIWPVLALTGVVLWWRQRPWWLLVAAGWLVLSVESSLFGRIESLLPPPIDFLLRFNYPYSVAWHGPIVPYMVLGAAALVWIARRRGSVTFPMPDIKTLLGAVAVSLIVVASSSSILAMSRPFVRFYGAFSSHNDVRAMRWIRDHTPRDARVLNYPGDYDNRRDWEAHWAPVVTERDCVYFRMQLFFLDAAPLNLASGPAAHRDVAAAYDEQRRMLAFWRDPAAPAHEALLRGARIGYVLAPEWIADPESLDRAWRWRPPERLSGVRSALERAPYLRIVHESGGARVYAMATALSRNAATP